MINGMVAGPDGRHMSKSLGNSISPDEVMPLFGADALRYWAAMGSLGDDYPFEFTWINLQTKQPVSNEKILIEKQKYPEDKFNKKYRRKYEQLIGAGRFITKIWNAYRFLFLNLSKIEINNIDINPNDLTEIDTFYFSEFNNNLGLITENLNGYNWHGATMILRTYFWNDMCDNYIEAIKHKFYSEDPTIKETSLKNALNLFYQMLKIFAVIMPFISEEIYAILFKRFTNLKSIHLEKWPTNYEKISEGLAEKGRIAVEIIKILRMNKSKFQIPLNKEISKVIILIEENQMKFIENIKEDIKNTIRIRNLEIMEKAGENLIKEKPDSKQHIEEPNITLYFFM